MERLEYFTSFWDFSNDQSISLALKLEELAPNGLTHSFFTSGGSESNESAIKIARLYHVRRGEPDRTWIIARRSGYHGVGYGSGTATGIDAYSTTGSGRSSPTSSTSLRPIRTTRSSTTDRTRPTSSCASSRRRSSGSGRIAWPP